MSIKNRKAISAHSSAFYEEQLPLFDAHVTDELAENEKAQIEQREKERNTFSTDRARW